MTTREDGTPSTQDHHPNISVLKTVGLELTAGRLFGLAGPLQKAPQPKQRSPARGGPCRASQQQGARGPVAQRPRHRRTPAPRFMSSWRGEEMLDQSPAHGWGSAECVPGSGELRGCETPVSERSRS